MSAYTISEVVEMAGPPFTPFVLRSLDDILQPSRSARDESFPGESMRLFDENGAVGAMVLAELRRQGASAVELRKAGLLPAGIAVAHSVIFDSKNFLWVLCQSDGELWREMKRVKGPFRFVDVAELRAKLR